MVPKLKAQIWASILQRRTGNLAYYPRNGIIYIILILIQPDSALNSQVCLIYKFTPGKGHSSFKARALQAQKIVLKYK